MFCFCCLVSWMLTGLIMLSGFVLITLTVTYIWYICTHRRLISVAKTLPTTVPPIPIFGHLIYMLRQPSKIKTKLIETMMRTSAARGQKAFVLWVGPLPSIYIQQPEDIQVALNSSQSLNRGFIYQMVEFGIGRGMFTGPVPLWRVIRRHFLPMFHGSSLEYIVPSSNLRGREIVEFLREQCSHSALDVLPFMRIKTFQNICNLMFGDETPESIPQEPELLERIVKNIVWGFELWSRRIATPWLFSNRIFNLLYKKDIEEITEVHQHFLKAPVEILRQKMAVKTHKTSSPGKSRTVYDAFIALNQADSSFKEQNFRGEILTLCVGEELYQEIVSVLGGLLTRDVTIDDLRKMTFLDKVVKETLRKFSVFTRLQRKTSEELKLSFGVLPAGTTFQVGIAGVHMNPHIYPDPELFQPERFSAENTAKRPKYSFIPFSGGPRNCIAGEYAVMFVKIVLVHIISRYKLHSTLKMSDVTLKFQIEVQIEQGYPIRIERRL